LNAGRNSRGFSSRKLSIVFYRNVSQKFPDFPDEDDGGSNAIFAKKNIDEIQEDLDAVGYSVLYHFD
jgi:hypothetical protein